jgi:hypothetical protein
MIAQCQGRPSLAASLRVAGARLEGDKLLIQVPAAFVEVIRSHSDEYRELARKAAGRSLQLEIAAAEAASSEPAPAPSPEEERRQKLRGEVEKEPAVQEALDLFDGRVVEVREAKASGEDL